MSALDLHLPGLEVARDARTQYGDPHEVFVDCLSRYPEAVAQGMRRELERLQRAGIPAFADGRRLWTPSASYFIALSGQPTRVLTSVADFDARARHAAKRMADRTGFSFNKTFRDQYLKEDSHA
ncbi:MAG: hypothetical protein BWY76_02179 [bacterium ADurb.Bin429]|nr:MAG: hypothetical protein BWY76_02179 [bacterium ADurb.Bin429]